MPAAASQATVTSLPAAGGGDSGPSPTSPAAGGGNPGYLGSPPTTPADFGEPPPVPVPDVTPPPPVVTQPPVTVARAPTLSEFATSFRPLPGPYKVVLQHPVTCAPVEVCFTLPPGCPRKVRVRPRELDFVYPGQTVAIRFVHNGTVRVRN